MALTQDVERESMANGAMYRVRGVLESGTFFKGALVNVDSAGRTVPASDTSGHRFHGYIEEPIGVAVQGSEGAVVKDDKVWIPLSDAALTDIMADFYATADDTVSRSATNVGRCGVCVDVRIGEAVLIDFSKAA